jgi:hypothetical protein
MPGVLAALMLGLDPAVRREERSDDKLDAAVCAPCPAGPHQASDPWHWQINLRTADVDPGAAAPMGTPHAA